MLLKVLLSAMYYLTQIAHPDQSPVVISRAEWRARPPISPENLTVPVPFVVIHHTYIPGFCNTTEDCKKAMRSMQDMHQIKRGWSDIGYNFAVGGDGNIYEGRGWGKVGAHAPKYNFMSVGIVFIGDFRQVLPTDEMLQQARDLIRSGVRDGQISFDYQLVGHRQVRDTECPGDALFQEIQSWPQWSPLIDIVPRT